MDKKSTKVLKRIVALKPDTLEPFEVYPHFNELYRLYEGRIYPDYFVAIIRQNSYHPVKAITDDRIFMYAYVWEQENNMIIEGGGVDLPV